MKNYTKENLELNLDEKPVFKVRGGRKEICEKWSNKSALPPGKIAEIVTTVSTPENGDSPTDGNEDTDPSKAPPAVEDTTANGNGVHNIMVSVLLLLETALFLGEYRKILENKYKFYRPPF